MTAPSGIASARLDLTWDLYREILPRICTTGDGYAPPEFVANYALKVAIEALQAFQKKFPDAIPAHDGPDEDFIPGELPLNG